MYCYVVTHTPNDHQQKAASCWNPRGRLSQRRRSMKQRAKIHAKRGARQDIPLRTSRNQTVRIRDRHINQPPPRLHTRHRKHETDSTFRTRARAHTSQGATSFPPRSSAVEIMPRERTIKISDPSSCGHTVARSHKSLDKRYRTRKLTNGSITPMAT